MLVNTKQLNVWGQTGFDLTEAAERRITEMVFGNVIDHVSGGRSPEYDVQLKNGKKIEVKFTNSNKIFIETSRYDGTPSGLSLTEADYYLIVHTGFFNRKIGKVKLIPTVRLKALDVAEICETKAYKPWKEGSPGSRGFVIDRELGKADGWQGNISFNEIADAFDLSGWTYKKR